MMLYVHPIAVIQLLFMETSDKAYRSFYQWQGASLFLVLCQLIAKVFMVVIPLDEMYSPSRTSKAVLATL